jgi:hypothetical protein
VFSEGRPAPRHNQRIAALRIVLGSLSLLMALGGALLIFSSKSPIVRVFMHATEFEVSTLLLAALKEMGGLALMLSAMLFLASLDPERNVAIIVRLALAGVLFYLRPRRTGWKPVGEFLKNETEGAAEEMWPSLTPFAFSRA